MGANAALAYVRGATPAVVQVGGDETIGKGLCGVKYAGAGNGGQR